MRTLKLDGGGQARLVEAPEPVPSLGEVVIRTRLSALCGSELHGYRGQGMTAGNSGHEGMGIVQAVGPGVSRVKLGQRVGVSAIAGCGRPECAACRQGQSTWCPDRRFYGSMHAEAFLTAETACLPLPEDVSDPVGVLLSGDGLGVPYHSSRKIAGEDVRTVAVFGLGPIGLGHVLLQAHLGRRVIGIDRVPQRLQLAAQLGAVQTVDACKLDPIAAIVGLTGGRGVDVAIEAAGVPATVQQCFGAVRTAGTVVLNGEQGPVELSPSEDFIRRDVRAVGSWFYHVGEFPEMLRLYREGLPAARLVTHVLPFEEAPQAFALFASGQTGKVMLQHGV
ncbi:MAG: zinc-binding dehydrogenase [Candidatus Latescibacterota bacterium]